MNDGKSLVRSRSVLGVKVDGDDETVQSEDLGEDQYENHADEQPRLLGRPSDARITHDPDGEPGGQAGETHGQTRAEVHETSATQATIV